MRQIDHIIEEGKFLNKLKKFFAPISDEESEKMGVVLPRNRYKEQAKYKAKQPEPVKKKFKTDKSGTVRSADRYGEPVEEKPKEKANEAVVSEADEPTDKATEVQVKISNLTKQLTHLRKSWDANSSRVRKDRKKLASERDSHVRDARSLATQREAADKARSRGT